MKCSGRVFLALLLPLLLAACDPRPNSERNPKSLLDFLSSVGADIEVKGVGDTLLHSAQQAEEKKQYGRAIQFYQQLVDKEPENLTYLARLADCSRRMGATDEAIQRFDEVLAKDPNHLEALEGKGLALLSKGEFDGASKQFQSVMQHNGTRWRTLNGVAILFVMKEMPKEALAYFEEALKQKPDEPVILNNVGLTLAMVQDYTRAVQALNSASERLESGSEDRKRADLNLALVYGLSGDMESAEDVARKHLKESALNNNLGFYAYLADNKELAKAYLNNALSGSSVFYEKAWKNLEIVGGNKGEKGSRYQQRNSGGGAGQGQPFSSYEVDEMYVPDNSVAAPVSAVSGGELQDLTPPKLPEKIENNQIPPQGAAVNMASPARMAAVDMQKVQEEVKVFPAVPVRPILDEGNVKPVAMVTPPPAAIPPTTQTMEQMTPRFAPETSSQVMQNRVSLPVNSELPPLLPEYAFEETPQKLASDTAKPLSRIRDPQSNILVFQKPEKKKKSPKKDTVVYQKKSEEESVETEEPEKEPVAKKKQVAAKKPIRRALPQPDETPEDEPLLKAPREQDPNEITQPVQQKSTVDVFRQIF